jgi:hypothetical protein
MTAQERLHAAHLAAMDGKYEDALAEYVWFHDHALEEQPSLYGVRLSFALSYWAELGQSYPPALHALLEVRDRKARSLFSGAADRELFHDVEAINQYLGDHKATSLLFEQLDREHPALAVECANLAQEALVAAGNYALAAKYLTDPQARIAKLAEQLSEDVARIPERPRSKSPRYGAYTWNFAQDLRLVMSALSGAGRASEAQACHDVAFSSLKPWYVRKEVQRALAGEV